MSDKLCSSTNFLTALYLAIENSLPGSQGIFSLLNLLTIAFFKAGVPSTAVYFVSPLLIALIAAFIMLRLKK